MSQTVTLTAYTPAERLPPPRTPISVFTPNGCELAVFIPGRAGSIAGCWRYREEEGEEIDAPIAYWADIPKVNPR